MEVFLFTSDHIKCFALFQFYHLVNWLCIEIFIEDSTEVTIGQKKLSKKIHQTGLLFGLFLLPSQL